MQLRHLGVHRNQIRVGRMRVSSEEHYRQNCCGHELAAMTTKGDWRFQRHVESMALPAILFVHRFWTDPVASGFI